MQIHCIIQQIDDSTEAPVGRKNQFQLQDIGSWQIFWCQIAAMRGLRGEFRPLPACQSF